MTDRAARRDAALREAFRGETPIRRALVMVCAWCPTAQDETVSARAHGFDVTHSICEKHAREFEAGALA